MQKTLLVLALAALLAACGQGSKTADPGDNTVNAIVKPTEAGEGYVVPDSILIELAHADSQIQRYHRHINLQEDTNQKASFMLDAVVLRNYLNANDSFVKLDVYLAKNDTGTLSLIYVGATLDTTDGKYEYVEHTYQKVKHNGETATYLLNHSFPCPKCDDRVRVVGHAGESH